MMSGLGNKQNIIKTFQLSQPSNLSSSLQNSDLPIRSLQVCCTNIDDSASLPGVIIVIKLLASCFRLTNRFSCSLSSCSEPESDMPLSEADPKHPDFGFPPTTPSPPKPLNFISSSISCLSHSAHICDFFAHMIQNIIRIVQLIEVSSISIKCKFITYLSNLYFDCYKIKQCGLGLGVHFCFVRYHPIDHYAKTTSNDFLSQLCRPLAIGFSPVLKYLVPNFDDASSQRFCLFRSVISNPVFHDVKPLVDIDFRKIVVDDSGRLIEASHCGSIKICLFRGRSVKSLQSKTLEESVSSALVSNSNRCDSKSNNGVSKSDMPPSLSGLRSMWT
ncbi:hypothetical protein AGLY_005214 [Aphis glycines]|uniref:Uncharacterized protein n=1 Tax=Aphis glycines TaxID=307491 RepID=A0A6G0TW57_APHGL|nr:hypothetical protein AGLY_005214 [Aphis glycines]